MIRITIIGVGPRGLSVLQRLAELAGRIPSESTVEVHLVDPGESGQGSHPSRQPAHLLTNTIANQVTMFAEGRGPSFTEWASQAGYRRFSGAYYPTGDGAGAAVGEHDYLPRSILGEYLSWVFDRTTSALPSRVRLVHHRDRAVDVEETAAGFVVRLDEGAEIHSDFVVLATGHCERVPTEQDRRFEAFTQVHAARNHGLVYASSPYPVDRLQRIAPGTDVAVQGFGLTAYDVISALTVGRGGYFDETGRYVVSGREPRIHLFSRNCLPFAARGVNQKGMTGRHRPRFFTRDAVRLLKERGPLDFETGVLPLLMHEMGYAYRMAAEQREIPPAEYRFSSEDRAAIERILDPLRGRTFANQSEFDRFFLDHVRDDLAQAELGNLTGPVKAATDVIRDTRASLREAVEFAGLTPASHEAFVTRYVPTMNRVSFGPPRRRNHELLELFRAGVVGLAGGPGCRVEPDPQTARFAIHTDYPDGRETVLADALVIARLDAFHPAQDSAPLTARLLTRGLVRPHRNGDFLPGGIDIDVSGRPITATGRTLPNMWALGYPVEGPRFYTHALPRQGLPSQFLTDADMCVQGILAQIQTGGGTRVHQDRQPVSVP